jgi:transcriptional regulator with XRE-family HTH domain
MSDFLKNVGEQIRTLRKERGLTQEVLSEETDLSPSYISDIERGERNISLGSLEKIIIALDVKSSDIFDFKNEIKNEQDEKQALMEIHNNLLATRRIDEVKFIHNVAKEFISTVDHHKK